MTTLELETLTLEPAGKDRYALAVQTHPNMRLRLELTRHQLVLLMGDAVSLLKNSEIVSEPSRV